MDGDAKSMVHRKQSKGVLSSSKAEFIPKCSIRTDSKPDESRSRTELKLSQQIFGILIKHLDEEKKMSISGMVKQNEKRSDCKSETTPTFRRIQDILH